MVFARQCLLIRTLPLLAYSCIIFSMAQLKPQPAAGAKSTVLMEQGQLPRTTAASKVAPTVLKTNKKVVTVAQANAFIELEDKIKNGEKVADKNQLVKAEDELNSNPALRALIKYLRKITYSEKYSDVHYEYRHVTLPRQQINPLIREYKEQVEVAPLLKKLLGGSLLAESEWREIGVIQSLGWVHYCTHRPEPQILLFRRSLGTLPAPAPAPSQSTSATAADLSAKINRMLSIN